MLQRSTQVGEFYRMRAPSVMPEPKVKHMYDIVIYDEEQDKHQHIRFLDALEAALPKDMIAQTEGWQPFGSKSGLTETGEGTAAQKQKKAAIDAAKAGTWAKMEIVVARPFICLLYTSDAADD